MIMHACPTEVGKRLFLIGAMVAMAMAGAAVEPAHIGPVKYLHDGKVDKICFDYQGTLRYREYQFSRAQYGYLVFEPAVLDDPKVRLKPQGSALKGVEVRPLNDGERQVVRLLYELNRWVAPSLRDTGSRMEISFAPGPEPAVPQPVLPADPTIPKEAIAAVTPVSLNPAGLSDPKDPLFAEYLKLDTQGSVWPKAAFPSASTAAQTQTAPEPKTLAGPSRAISDALSLNSGIERSMLDARRSTTLTAAQGGEGTSPADDPVTAVERAPVLVAKAAPRAQPAETTEAAAPATPAAQTPGTSKPLGAAKFEVVKPAKAFVPESGLTGTGPGKITGGRGFEFVDLSETQFQKKVSMIFKDADLQNAIRVLARQAELNLVMDPTQVKGRVTVELNNVTVGPALATILRTNELELIREAGGIYRVVPSRMVRRTPQREETTVHVPLNWVSADDAAKILSTIVEGRVAADSIGNALIITDTPLKIEEIANVIGRIDRPEKQVMLEARLVEMDTDLGRELGISWDLARVDRDIAKQALLPILGQQPSVPKVIGFDPVSGAPITFTPASVPIIGTNQGLSNPLSFDQRDLSAIGRTATEGMDSLSIAEPFIQTHGAKLAFGRAVRIFGQQFQLSTLLQAAEDANLAKTLAAPRVATVNNQPANINITRKIPYRSTVIGAGGVQSETWAYEDIGVTMKITPNITNNDYIRMKIQPTQRILIGQSGTARPTVDERVSETNIIVKDEDTAVVAGLRQQSFNETGRGVPWLQEIPVLGWLFKSRTYGNRKTDLLAFVTPHIIKEAQVVTDQERQRYSEIDVQWDLPDYFFDDVKFDLNKK